MRKVARCRRVRRLYSRMMRTLPLAFTGSILIFLGTGCAALNLKQPTASLRAVSVPNVSAQAIALNFDMNVENPNSFSIPLSQAQYKLALGGVQVLDDSIKPSASIPANGSLPVTIPVSLSFKDLLSAEQALARSGGNVPYTFDGGLDFSTSKIPMAPTLHAPLHFSGTLPLRDAFQKLLHDPSLLTNPDARKLLGTIFGGSGILGNLLGHPGQ